MEAFMSYVYLFINFFFLGGGSEEEHKQFKVWIIIWSWVWHDYGISYQFMSMVSIKTLDCAFMNRLKTLLIKTKK